MEVFGSLEARAKIESVDLNFEIETGSFGAASFYLDQRPAVSMDDLTEAIPILTDLKSSAADGSSSPLAIRSLLFGKSKCFPEVFQLKWFPSSRAHNPHQNLLGCHRLMWVSGRIQARDHVSVEVV